MPKVDKNNWEKTMKNIVLHCKLIRGAREPLLAYVAQCHIKVAHILPRYGTYLNLDERMIARAPIVDTKLNLKMNHESLDRVYL